MIKTSSKIFFGFILLFVAIFTGVAVGEIYLENTRSCSADVAENSGYISNVDIDVFRTEVSNTIPCSFLGSYMIYNIDYNSSSQNVSFTYLIDFWFQNYNYSSNTISPNTDFYGYRGSNLVFAADSSKLLYSNSRINFYYGDSLTSLSSSVYLYSFASYTYSTGGFSNPVRVVYGYMNQSTGMINTFPYYYGSLPVASTLYFYVSFVDMNNNAITFYVATNIPRATPYYFNYDVISVSLENASQQSIDYNSGLNAGISQGYDNGYSVGRSDGYDVGYNVGFSDGVADDNDYTFVGLISAVIDVPVTTFTSLFNFDILGVNLKDFLLGLFGIAIVVTIIRFVLVK